MGTVPLRWKPSWFNPPYGQWAFRAWDPWAAEARRRGGAISRHSWQVQLCRWKQVTRGVLGWTVPSVSIGAWKTQLSGARQPAAQS